VKRYSGKTFVLEVVMLLVSVAFFFPVYVLINLALKPLHDQSSPTSIVRAPTADNFTEAWNQGALGHGLVTSAIITTVSVALIVVVAAPAAYALARMTSRWSRAVFFVFMLGLLLPVQLGTFPLYTTMGNLHLLGTRLSMVIIYTGLQVPFSVFLYALFLRALPLDYEEAARIDGAGPLRTFIEVVFPLLRPVTGTVVILNAVFISTDFFLPLLYLSGSPNETAPVALYSFVTQFVTHWNLVFAGVIITITPVLIAYFAMQRSIIRGFAGGVKG
jgi:raffinose/stachyose/melibiose transport system permease protein